MSIGVVGIGNTLRADDGVGSFVCSRLDALKLPGVTTLVVQQLDLSLLEDLLLYKYVVLVDASVDGKEVDFSALVSGESQALASSHHVNAVMLGALSRRVYGKELSLFLCAIRGEDFSIGNSLSDRTCARAEKAVQLISEWVYSLS